MSHSVRGGVIYDLFWGFHDGVLWFVRALLLLYLCFSLFIRIREKYNQTITIISINLLTLCAIAVLQIVIGLADYSIISIPLFTIGILASIFNKGQTVGIINLACCSDSIFHMEYIFHQHIKVL